MTEVRSIKSGELPSLAALYDELIEVKTNVAKMTTVYNAIKDNDNYIILGAFNDSDLIGSLMGIVCFDIIGDCKPFMVIENVIVSDRARRQGIGKQLMMRIEQIAIERGCWYIILVSGETRKEAHRFYEQLGFKEEKVEGYRKHLK
ncbi:GNAT family N-acetyltransferase [Cohnella yongneupensis]|uniref:GNAT family N-acetyltransferase n=1 Tax=Cohnella yongneupensis TaxID=425006 RepID=A0ABW0QXI5_9BACL